MTFHYTQEARSTIAAKADAVFAFLDDQASLGGHMEKPSAMMLGGSMHYTFDEGEGRIAGSVIRMGGKILGLTLTLQEEVTEHERPRRKVWQTVGTPHILVVGAYRMGFEIEADGIRSLLRVFIEYDLPASRLGNFFGLLFARPYARWCVSKMAEDAAMHFKAGHDSKGRMKEDSRSASPTKDIPMTGLHHNHLHSPSGDTTAIIDPVCGMTVDPDKTAHHSHYEGVDFHFFAVRGAWQSSPPIRPNISPPPRARKPLLPTARCGPARCIRKSVGMAQRHPDLRDGAGARRAVAERCPQS